MTEKEFDKLYARWTKDEGFAPTVGDHTVINMDNGATLKGRLIDHGNTFNVVLLPTGQCVDVPERHIVTSSFTAATWDDEPATWDDEPATTEP